MNIRRVTEADIPRMVAIAEAKRVEYEGYSPVLWRKASDSAPKQELFFQRLLTGTDVIALVAETEATLLGFVMGVITTAPPVYNPGGLVCIVDDFAVGNPTEWGVYRCGTPGSSGAGGKSARCSAVGGGLCAAGPGETDNVAGGRINRGVRVAGEATLGYNPKSVA